MNRWIALFRGINVGGNNILPMKALVIKLAQLKLTNIRTYIQSGNVVFDSRSKNASTLAKSIRNKVEQEHGFAPQIFMLGLDDLQRAISESPFPNAVSDPKSLHFCFLEHPATNANIEALDSAKTSTEDYRITDGVFYLHAPDGVGRSKLASMAEKFLGVTITSRNYRTVEKIMALANQ
ncbi:MAG: DUF1697 domain-containing protein [Aureliella sp.]